MTQYDDVVYLVENLFGLVVDYKSIATIQRPFDSYLVTLKFSTESNKVYLLKEFISQSPQHLACVFSTLEKIRNGTPRLLIPLPTKNGLYHLSDSHNRNFQLLEFLDLSPFDRKKFPLKKLFKELNRLHSNLSKCPVPANQYTNLGEYVVVGVRRIQGRYGSDLPFLSNLESFINHLPIDTIPQGVRHGDIQETNVCLLGDEVIFIDCDDVHFGYPLMDYIQGAVLYLDQDKLDRPEYQAIVEELWQQVKAEASDITKKDVRYLLTRVMLGPIQGGDIQPSKETLARFLLDLECFSEGGE